MPPSRDEPLLQDDGNDPWSNKHDTYVQPVRRRWNLWRPSGPSTPERYNATTRLLQRVLADARAQHVRVRAYGGGWSFSGAPATDGWLINTKPADYRFRLRPELLDPAYTGDAEGLRFLQCGNSVTLLDVRLREEGRSLRTCGASNGQTIVGAMSTGTHGSAIDVGAVQDYVRGIHLVVAPDRHLYLQPASAPVVKAEFPARIEAELVADDDLFHAALVNLGGLGFVHGVLIETDPLFLLRRFRMKHPLNAALRQAIRTLDASGLPVPAGIQRPFHFEVVMNPYDTDHATWVTVMVKEPYTDNYVRPVRDPNGFGPGDNVLGVMGRLFGVIPGVIPAAMTTVLNLQFHEGVVVGTLGEIFTDTTTEGKAAGAAFGVPHDRIDEALDTVLGAMRDGGPFPCLVALRFVRGTAATLGFTRFPETCVIDVDGPLSAETRACYQQVRSALVAHGIPYTQHWGKIVDMNADDVRQCYGGAVDTWRAARDRLLAPEERFAFSNAFLEGLGLA